MRPNNNYSNIIFLVSGANAHQSHTTAAHSDVLSVAFYAGKKRFLSGHIHQVEESTTANAEVLRLMRQVRGKPKPTTTKSRL